jgi:hypothetical protein
MVDERLEKVFPHGVCYFPDGGQCFWFGSSLVNFRCGLVRSIYLRGWCLHVEIIGRLAILG